VAKAAAHEQQIHELYAEIGHLSTTRPLPTFGRPFKGCLPISAATRMNSRH
jgi:hypothetical protein